MPSDRRPDDKAQKPHALASLYSRYLPELILYVRAKFGDGPPDPEDVAQEAFSRFSTADKTQTIRNPRAFLYASVRNLVIDDKRRARTREIYADDLQKSGGAENSDGISPERVLIEKERFAIMRAAIETMNADDRRVLLMHRLQSRTYADIARTLGMSESSVRRAVARAVAHLDAAMKERGAE